MQIGSDERKKKVMTKKNASEIKTEIQYTYQITFALIWVTIKHTLSRSCDELLESRNSHELKTSSQNQRRRQVFWHWHPFFLTWSFSNSHFRDITVSNCCNTHENTNDIIHESSQQNVWRLVLVLILVLVVDRAVCQGLSLSRPFPSRDWDVQSLIIQIGSPESGTTDSASAARHCVETTWSIKYSAWVSWWRSHIRILPTLLSSAWPSDPSTPLKHVSRQLKSLSLFDFPSPNQRKSQSLKSPFFRSFFPSLFQVCQLFS